MSKLFRVKAYDHIKVAVQNISEFERQIETLGFSQSTEAAPAFLNKPTSVWGSGDAVFVIYAHTHPEAKSHWDMHGDTVFDLCFWVDSLSTHPTVYEGAGKMKHTLVNHRSFKPFPSRLGVQRFDHNTINVERGQLEGMVTKYESDFGLEKGQYFDIKGKSTGLYSWVTRTPNHNVQIPFNEAQDPKSQIQEYIDTHKGAGVQHIALLTDRIIPLVSAVRSTSSSISFLETPDTYYELAKNRVKIRENIDDLQKLRILVDQDAQQGYLLQIFTNNIFGAFFFEIIQREGNSGFGEGNFQALFDAMELDQKRRGVI